MLFPVFLLLSACDPTPATLGNAVTTPVSGPTVAPANAVAAPKKAVPAAGTRITSLDDFWARFRRAALAGDAAAIRALSAPVIQQRSTLDDAPPVRLPAARVAAAVAQVMALPDGVDPAGRTHRAIMAATPSPARDPQQPATHHRFGDLVFERGTTGWKLTEIYLEPAE